MFEFKPLKTFGQMWGPLCVQGYKFSHELTVFPGSAAPQVPHSFYLQGAVPRRRSAPHGVLNSCHLLSLGGIQVHSQGASFSRFLKEEACPKLHSQGLQPRGSLFSTGLVEREKLSALKQLQLNNCADVAEVCTSVWKLISTPVVRLCAFRGLRQSRIVQKFPQLCFLLPLLPLTLVLYGKEVTGSEILPIPTNMTS